MDISKIVVDSNGVTTWLVDGKPFIALAGELHNSSTSNAHYMEERVWPALRPLGLNTVLAPVAWETIEPIEGAFDFTLVDQLVEQARREGLRLALLWFGLWKNGESWYTPEWVKRDTVRFFRARLQGGLISDTVSPFCEAGINADAPAFARLMAHVKEIDEQYRTVIMVQVENEVGILGAERDFCEAANCKFSHTVPDELAQLIPTVSPVSYKSAWSEAFGEDAPELFMAWHYASALERIAAAGKAEYPLPMYANAWLRQFPERPGIFPSGGPTATVLTVWQIAAPSLDALAPDIYVTDFEKACADYGASGYPLLIPEARRDPVCASNAIFAIGRGALLFSPFAIDAVVQSNEAASGGVLPSIPDDKGYDCQNTALYLRAAYRLLSQAMPMLVEYGSNLTVFHKASQHQLGTILPMEDCDLVITYLDDEPGKPGTSGIVFERDTNDFIIVGCRFTVKPLAKRNSGKRVSIITFEEGSLDGIEWRAGRVLNGDERNTPRIGDIPGAIRLKVLMEAIV
ncbi:beta-galactosidase [Clostridia bacterium]|nr:beta-galactosidase [Clostridia bacterium]